MSNWKRRIFVLVVAMALVVLLGGCASISSKINPEDVIKNGYR